MDADKRISDFVSQLRAAAGENLQSVILYGSAAGADFHPDYSDVNLLCIMRDCSFASLQGIAPGVKSWTKQKHRAPLLMTREELERSADVFSIELLDMKERHRVLFGEDVLSGLQVPMHLHRAQLEYELREKLILLREHVVRAAGDKKQLWKLLSDSLSTFVTLFRHALLALGAKPAGSKREAVQALATRITFDPSAFLQLLDIREGKASQKQFDVTDVCARYLTAVERVTSAIDRMLDSAQAGSS